MMRKQFGLLSWFFSLVGAGIGGFLAALLLGKCNDTWTYILWSGALFLLIFCGGFLGVQLSLLVNKRYRMQQGSKWLAAGLISGVAIFAVGCGGQALFLFAQTAAGTSPAVMLLAGWEQLSIYLFLIRLLTVMVCAVLFHNSAISGRAGIKRCKTSHNLSLFTKGKGRFPLPFLNFSFLRGAQKDA